jgi:hypothetical protein
MRKNDPILQTKAMFEELLGDVEEASKQKQVFELPVIPAPRFYMHLDIGNSEQRGDELFSRLEQKSMSALAGVTLELDAHLKAMMGAGWGWTTGSRNIIDTGTLMGSGGASFAAGAITIGYAAAYANLIHNGGYIHPYGNTDIDLVYIPGRPWVSATLGKASGPLPPFDWKASFFRNAN